MIIPTHNGRVPVGTDIAYSVILPAYNEEKLLGATLSSLARAMDSLSCRGEIIVIDNNSSDKTPQIAREHGARVIFEPERQIAKARNRGGLAATGEYLVFLDADTILSPELLQKALALLASGKYCGGGTLLRYDAKLPFLAGSLVSCWNWISRTFGLAAGSFIFCLSSGFHAAGGFDESVFAGEEVIFSRRLKSWARKNHLRFSIITDDAVLTSSRKFQWHSSLKIASLLVLFTIFPGALRHRSFCNFWYRRPIQ